jgi:hypothetical protein
MAWTPRAKGMPKRYQGIGGTVGTLNENDPRRLPEGEGRSQNRGRDPQCQNLTLRRTTKAPAR